MELKTGYRKSEVGIIPKDWDVIALGDIFKFKNGINKEKRFFGQGTPIVNYMDVYSSRGLYSKNIRGRVQLTNHEIKQFEVQKGDVFFTRTSETVDEIGVASVLLDEVVNTVFSGFILRARHKNNRLDNKFEKYCYSTDSVRKKIISKSSFTTRALTNGRSLSKVKIAVPKKIMEQQAIAEALSDADANIEALEGLIAKKRQIKQGVMQELLTGKRRLPGFKDKWRTVRLANIGKFISGCGFPLTYQGKTEGEYPFFKVSDMNLKQNSVYMNVSNNWINEEDRKVLNIKPLPKDTIVFAKIGAAIFLERKRLLSQQSFIDNNMMGLIVTDEQIDFRFVFFQMLSIKLGNHTSTTALPYLNSSEIENIEIYVPELREQKEIIEILNDLESELFVLKEKQTKYIKIKYCMMHELLTGRIRLV